MLSSIYIKLKGIYFHLQTGHDQSFPTAVSFWCPVLILVSLTKATLMDTNNLLGQKQGCSLPHLVSHIIFINTVSPANHHILPALYIYISPRVVQHDMHPLCKIEAGGWYKWRRKESAAGSVQALHDSVFAPTA